MGCIICKDLSDSVVIGFKHYEECKKQRNQTSNIQNTEKSDTIGSGKLTHLSQNVIDDKINIENKVIYKSQELVKPDIILSDSDFEIVSKKE